MNLVPSVRVSKSYCEYYSMFFLDLLTFNLHCMEDVNAVWRMFIVDGGCSCFFEDVSCAVEDVEIS